MVDNHKFERGSQTRTGMMPPQDDLYIEFLFLHSLREHGLDVTAEQMARRLGELPGPQYDLGRQPGPRIRTSRKGFCRPGPVIPTTRRWATPSTSRSNPTCSGSSRPVYPVPATPWATGRATS